MKILMILESEFPPDVRVENEIFALEEAGHEIHLACSTRKGRPSDEIIGNIIIHRRPISSLIYKSSVGCLKLPFYFNFWRKFLSEICQNQHFDTIHVHDLPLIKVAAELKKRFKTLLVIDLHENWPALLKTATHTQTIIGRLLSSNRQWVDYERKMLPSADKIITIIQEAAERVIGLGIQAEKVAIVSNTINFENLKFAENKVEPGIFTLFYGGGINRHRGLQIVIQALDICRKRNINVRLWIVGDGSYKADLELLCEKLNMGENVKFFGFRPFKEMLEILSAANAAIIPHLRTENNDASSPNKLYQYMYLDKPVISSDCTSLKRIINESQTGFIYKADSFELLASLLELLVNDRTKIAALKGNGRKAVLNEFNWNIDKKRLVTVYAELEHKIKDVDSL